MSGLNVYQRLQKVQQAVAYVQKDKQIENKYWAVTHDQVTSLVRPHFVEQGIIIVPRLVNCAMLDTGRKSSNGTPIMRFEGSYEVSFVNVDEPTDVVVVPVAAHAEDMGDKAPGKALSYATKYSILKILLLESGESDESRIPQTKLSADDLVKINQDIDAAKDLESLRTIVEAGMEWAKDSDDSKAHSQIKAWGTTKAATFGASAPNRQPVRAKSEKQPATIDHETGEVESPAHSTTPAAHGTGANAPDVTVRDKNGKTVESKVAPAGLIRILKAKAAAKGITEQQLLATHEIEKLDGISVELGNHILKSLNAP